eukprot:4390951-Alexandrium_andersonii.AAC.1
MPHWTCTRPEHSDMSVLNIVCFADSTLRSVGIADVKVMDHDLLGLHCSVIHALKLFGGWELRHVGIHSVGHSV